MFCIKNNSKSICSPHSPLLVSRNEAAAVSVHTSPKIVFTVFTQQPPDRRTLPMQALRVQTTLNTARVLMITWGGTGEPGEGSAVQIHTLSAPPLTFALLPVGFFLFWSSDGVSEWCAELSSLADLSQMMVFAAEPARLTHNTRAHRWHTARSRTHTSKHPTSGERGEC